jgi:Fe-Mn family superoxide dismutase
MQELQVKPLKYEALNGLSSTQLKEHHDVLYAGYVKKLNEIRAKLAAADKSEANASYSLYGELKREETFTANGIRLHEAYFDNMGGDGIPDGAIQAMINEDFGSLDAWKEDITAAGIAARGWVITAFDLTDGHVYNYLCDTHNLGCIWNCVPLIVLDVYEHAYFIDYATARKKYIEVFLQNLDFTIANEAIARNNLIRLRTRV